MLDLDESKQQKACRQARSLSSLPTGSSSALKNEIYNYADHDDRANHH
ncbi:hypothetical protein [Peribacillus muralis]|nr:hypothetical protein [Peribacillus muralis]